jgi:hypothetical protein
MEHRDDGEHLGDGNVGEGEGGDEVGTGEDHPSSSVPEVPESALADRQLIYSGIDGPMVVVHVDWIVSRSALRRDPLSATESMSLSRTCSSIPGGPHLGLNPPRKIACDTIVLIIGRADGRFEK